jgi:hypothetical protein
MTTLRAKPLVIEEEETRLERIVYPEDLAIATSQELNQDEAMCRRASLFRGYFLQRLGNQTPKSPRGEEVFPALVLERSEFIELLWGPYPIWAQMWDEDPSCWEEWFLVDSQKRPELVILALSIETPDVGQRTLDFLQRVEKSPVARKLFHYTERLAEEARKLHRLWQSRTHRFVRCSLVPEDFVNRRTRLATTAQKALSP